MICRRYILTAAVLATLLVTSVSAGFLSYPAKKMLIRTARESAEQTAKRSAQAARSKITEIIEAPTDYARKRMFKDLGNEAAENALAIGAKHGLSNQKTTALVSRVGNYARDPRAVEWVMRHGEKGAFFINRFGGYERVAAYGLDSTRSAAVVNEGWKLVRGNGGSWSKLRQNMTRAGLNSNERDFAEDLFKMRSEAGKFIPGMKKGDILVSGHVGTKRTGVDFIKPNGDGTFSVIEFGTGRKPSAKKAGEMTWKNVREQLHEKFSNLTPDEKILLRERGVDNSLILKPEQFLDRRFPVQKYVKREIYAVEKDVKLARKLQREPGGLTFHLLY